MAQKGHKQTEETKKKISEALTKNKGKVTSVRSPIARQLQKEFNDSRTRSEGIKAEMRRLLEMRKSQGRKKSSKSGRDKITAQLKALQSNLKNEALARKAIVEHAHAERRVKQAKLVIEKSILRSVKLASLKQTVKDRLRKAKTPEQKEKLKEYLIRIEDNVSHQKDIVKSAKAVISSRGGQKKSRSKTFDFSVSDIWGIESFEEREFAPWRELTVQEKRANLKMLNDQFNQIEDGLETALIEEIMVQVDTTAKKAEDSIDAADIALTALILFGGSPALKSHLNTAAKQAYTVGKKSAAQELDIPEPPTDKQNNQLRAAENEEIVDGFTQDMQNTARTASRNAIVSGATPAVAVVAIRSALTKVASKFIATAVGTIPAQYVNRGRKQVFYDNLLKITHFQRSEVLDSRTCNICLSLDKRIVTADDPFAHLEVVHSSCRGTWVPIFTEDDQPKASAVGIPKSISNAFNTIDGRPVVNDFKQMKKATAKKDNPDAKDEIAKRLKK